VDVEAKCGQVRHVIVTMNLFVAPVFVPKVAPLPIRAELLPVELPAVLRLVLVVGVGGLLLLAQVSLTVVLTELILAVGILTLGAVAAEAGLYPVLAHIALVHRPLDEALLSQVCIYQLLLLLLLLSKIDCGWRMAGWKRTPADRRRLDLSNEGRDVLWAVLQAEEALNGLPCLYW